MGIQDINPFLKDKSVPFKSLIDPKDFSGFRVVIDASLWICTNASVFFRDAVYVLVDPVNEEMDRTIILNRMINQAIRFQMFWFRNGITPVWVWEGGFPPDKEITKAERCIVYNKLKSKVTILKDKLRPIDPLFRTIQDIDALKKAIIMAGRINNDEVEYLKGMISSLGFPSITAPDGVEADPICASLCLEVLAIATWSTDTDHYAYGTPFLLTGFGPRDSSGKDTLELSTIPIIKSHLDWTQEQLREFCIICGCDYNKRIPNYGCKKGFKLLSENNWNIEEIAAKRTDLKVENLRAERCRELLIAPASGFTHDDPRLNVDKELFVERIRILSEHFQIQSYFDELVKLISDLPNPERVILSD
jgi:5'-3' exonuclease